MEGEIIKPLSFFSMTPILHDAITPERKATRKMIENWCKGKGN
jgi:hypothetical protein